MASHVVTSLGFNVKRLAKMVEWVGRREAGTSVTREVHAFERVTIQKAKVMSQDQVVFGCAITNAAGEGQACLLAESIRTYGGRFSAQPISVFVPAHSYRMSEGMATAFERLGVRRLEFDIDPVAKGVPFTGKVMASAMAEKLLSGDSSGADGS